MGGRLVLIAAVARNGVIGAGGAIPWRSREDMRHFAATTRGHPVIMGRRTYESIGRPLPERRNIVVSRNPRLAIEGCETAVSLEGAIKAASAPETTSIFVAGGGEIYRLAMPLADAMVISRMDVAPEGDAKFPEYPAEQWRLVRSEEHAQCDPRFAIEWLERA